jgi:8-oxo-dGTP pyrophosphatase MutT (NUDIX family)
MDSQVAVKAVIVNLDNEALIMSEKGRWQAPGGRLEAGETLLKGLVREVFEETGLQHLEIGDVVHVDEWFAKPEGIRKHIVAIFFVCHTQSDQIVLSDEHDDFAWITPADFDDYELELEMKTAIAKVLT